MEVQLPNSGPTAARTAAAAAAGKQSVTVETKAEEEPSWLTKPAPPPNPYNHF